MSSSPTAAPAPAPAPASSLPTVRTKLASGAVSGLVACVTLQPADLLKTRLQEDARKALAHAVPGQPRGVHPQQRPLEGRTARLLRVTREVLRADGVRGLWRGTAPTVVRNVPGVALYLTSVAEVRRVVAQGRVGPPVLSVFRRADGKPGLTTAGELAAGGVTRVAVGFVLAPVTVAKTRMESAHFGGSNTAYRSVGGSLRAIYLTQGVRGLWQGFGATAVRDAPYAGLYLAIYQHTRRLLSSAVSHAERHQQPDGVRSLLAGNLTHQALAWQSASAGVIAGTLATILTHPFDVLKTRAQTYKPPGPLDSGTASSSGSMGQQQQQQQQQKQQQRGWRPPGMVRTARTMLASEPGAFLDGIGLRCARKAASSAIAWCIFEVGSSAWTTHTASLPPRPVPTVVQSA